MLVSFRFYHLPPLQPVNDSKYNYSLVDGKIIRSLNIPLPEIPTNTTEPEIVAPAARKERAAAKSS